MDRGSSLPCRHADLPSQAERSCDLPSTASIKLACAVRYTRPSHNAGREKKEESSPHTATALQSRDGVRGPQEDIGRQLPFCWTRRALFLWILAAGATDRSCSREKSPTWTTTNLRTPATIEGKLRNSCSRSATGR